MVQSEGYGNYLGDYEPELLSWSGGITQVNSPPSFAFPLASTVVQDAMPAVGLRQTINGATIGSITGLNAMKALVDEAAHPTEYGNIVKGTYGGEMRGFYYTGSSNYQSDIAGQTVTHAACRFGTRHWRCAQLDACSTHHQSARRC
ncbi:MAG: hypothetical protein IPO90_10770 [Flavobacteriales bacterium]|nr:hypothetical protein [Flavobacteriales bacterium]